MASGISANSLNVYGTQVPLEKIDSSYSSQASAAKKAKWLWAKFTGVFSQDYVKVTTGGQTYKVHVETLKEALKGKPESSLKGAALQKWVIAAVRMARSPGGVPLRREQSYREVYSNLGIQGKTVEEAKKLIEAQYNFLSQKSKDKLDIDKLKRFNYKELKKLATLLFAEFKIVPEGTKHAMCVRMVAYPALSDLEFNQRTVLDGVRTFLDTVEKNWNSFSNKTGAPWWKRQDLLNGKGGEYEEQFKNWWIDQQSQSTEDPG
jgi:hypothetical protein